MSKMGWIPNQHEQFRLNFALLECDEELKKKCDEELKTVSENPRFLRCRFCNAIS